MEDKNNPLLCDPKEGVCAIPGSEANNEVTVSTNTKTKELKIVYFTDPICSTCWGIEPQLRKLKLEYGQLVEIEYRMGGLLPNWSYNSGGISQPSDVAHHWDEVSEHYDMPIDGDVWLEDPLHSSYPPSIAYKAVELQAPDKAPLFLRTIREMVFLQKKNIAKEEQLIIAAQKLGLDIVQFKTDMAGKAKDLFEEDLKMARAYGVRGFPTLFFLDEKGQKQVLYGLKPYAFYETTILTMAPELVKQEYHKNWEKLFAKYASWTAREFSEVSGTPRKESEVLLNQLTADKKLDKWTTKNGSIWTIKPNH
ncbi:MAG: ClpXP adapter SpxH family protein [Aureispira sp.]